MVLICELLLFVNPSFFHSTIVSLQGKQRFVGEQGATLVSALTPATLLPRYPAALALKKPRFSFAIKIGAIEYEEHHNQHQTLDRS
jgi:hypothetical protein